MYELQHETSLKLIPRDMIFQTITFVLVDTKSLRGLEYKIFRHFHLRIFISSRYFLS